MRRLSVCVTAIAIAACTRAPAPPLSDAGGAVDVQVLSLSQWLAQLDPVTESDAAGVDHAYGGLAALSSYFAADRAANPNTLLLMAPGSFGASPPLSSQFADEPAVKALGFLGASADSLSNYNFGNGIPYLSHLVGLSSYPYVSSNMNGVVEGVSTAIRAPYVLLDAGGAKIGVLGITSPGAPNHTSPGRFGAITISEPISAANAAASSARAAGAQVVVVLTDLDTIAVDHAGAHSGPLIDFASGVNGVDVVIGSSDVVPGTPRVGSVLVVEHSKQGRTYGRTHLHLVHGGLASATAEVVAPDVARVTPDPKADALLASYRSQLATLFDASISLATSSFPLDGSERHQEAAIGDLLADAFLARYAAAGAQIAVFNGAGIRDSLPSTYAPADRSLRRPQSGYAVGPPFDVLVGDAYTILPFGDACVVRPVTGATLWLMLEQSVFSAPTQFTGFLQIAGFKFVYRVGAQAGTRVQSVTLDDGTRVARDDTRTWMLVDTNYVDRGGDGYGMLIESPPTPTRDVAADVFLAYLKANAPLIPALSQRITQVP